MTDWVPLLPPHGGPRYVAIVDQLEKDIASGRVKPGTRLLPQRDMAERLGLSVGTISNAYAEAEQRGLISGEVGRGTFVRQSNHLAITNRGRIESPVNLALNVPPATGEDRLIAATLAELSADGSIAGLLGYLPHQGRQDHRDAVSAWLNGHGLSSIPERTFVTHGAQHGLSIALGLVAKPGGVVLTESFTYSGMLALANMSGYRLHGVAGDADGIIPEQLDRALAETGSRVLYCMPTLQTPTGTVMSGQRRREIAEIIRRYDAYIIEDDAYAFLFRQPPEPLSSLLPERSFYIVSFAKCLSPGLRIGAMVAPETYRDRCINAIRATGWMAAPVMAEVIARLIRNGALVKQAELKREAAVLRNRVAQLALKGWLPEPANHPGFHLWLPLPAGRTINALVTQAAQAGITLAPPGALRSVDPASLGVRLCLGAPSSEVELQGALLVLRDILQQAESISFV